MTSGRICGSSVRTLLSALFLPEIRIWRGKESPSKVFWDYGIFVSSVIILFYATAAVKGLILTQQILLLCFAAFTAWFLISILRCAVNADPFWASLVLWLIVPWAMNTLLISVFLQIDLVATYLS